MLLWLEPFDHACVRAEPLERDKAHTLVGEADQEIIFLWVPCQVLNIHTARELTCFVDLRLIAVLVHIHDVRLLVTQLQKQHLAAFKAE